MKKYALILAIFFLTAGFTQASGVFHLRLLDQNHVSTDVYYVTITLYYQGISVPTCTITTLQVSYPTQNISINQVPVDTDSNLYYYTVDVYKNNTTMLVYSGYVSPGLFNTDYWEANDFYKTCSF